MQKTSPIIERPSVNSSHGEREGEARSALLSEGATQAPIIARLQGMFSYMSGRSVTEEIPYLTFLEEELKDAED